MSVRRAAGGEAAAAPKLHQQAGWLWGSLGTQQLELCGQLGCLGRPHGPAGRAPTRGQQLPARAQADGARHLVMMICLPNAPGRKDTECSWQRSATHASSAQSAMSIASVHCRHVL